MNLRSFTALLSVLLVAVPPVMAQDDGPRVELGEQHWYSRLTQRYTPSTVLPINLANSNRIDSLVRAGHIYLSLADAIALALENNIDVEVQRYTFMLNETALKRARAGGAAGGANVNAGGAGGGGGNIIGGGGGIPSYDPVFTGNLNWNHLTQAQSNVVTSGGLTANVNEVQTANFGIQQGFVTGATAALALNNNQTSSNNPNNNYNPSTNSSLGLQISQPLLQGFGIALNNRNIRIAKNNVRASDYTFEQQVITTVNTVSQTYWNLVSATLDVEAKKQTLAQAQKLYEDNQKQVEIGTLAPISIVQAEAQVATSEADLLTSQGNVLIQETNLKNVISRNGLFSPAFADASIIPTDRVRLPDVEPVEPVQDLVQRAVDRRPDLAQTRVQIENTRITMTGTRNSMLPQLNVVSTIQNNALSGEINPIPNVNPLTGATAPRQTNPYFIGGYGNILAQILRRNFPNYSIGFQLNIPLRNRAAQADYTTAQLQLRQSELNLQKSVNQVRVDIQNALNNVQQARARYQAATKARVLQEQTLDAEEKKNALGASTVYNVILVQRDLANARQTEVTALTAYAQAKVQLDVATGTLLDHNNITLDEAKSGRVSRAPDPIREPINTPPAAAALTPSTTPIVRP
jgi:outer membrane protein TolC